MTHARALGSILALAVALLVVTGAAFLGACGPSDLAKALGKYESQLQLRLDDEGRFWNQLADHSADQEDARGVAKYRTFLETKAVTYYVELDRALREMAPTHERLVKVHAAVGAYVRSKQDFIDLELKRLERFGGAREVQLIAALQEAEAANEDARAEYMEAIVDDFPDNRMSTLSALRDEFVSDWYRPALAGKIEPEAVVAYLRKRTLVELRKLRDDRFDDAPRTRLFRKWVVAADEYFNLLADAIPTAIGAARATVRIEELQQAMKRQQSEYQRLLREVQRDK